MVSDRETSSGYQLVTWDLSKKIWKVQRQIKENDGKSYTKTFGFYNDPFFAGQIAHYVIRYNLKSLQQLRESLNEKMAERPVTGMSIVGAPTFTIMDKEMQPAVELIEKAKQKRNQADLLEAEANLFVKQVNTKRKQEQTDEELTQKKNRIIAHYQKIVYRTS